MQPTSQKEINEVLKELNDAMLECLELSKLEKQVKVDKIKAHYRLSKAREEVRAIQFYE